MAKRRRKFTQCPNCGYIFEEVNNYCPNCGQENHDLNVPAKHLIAEFFEGTLHFDTKVWHTLKLLLFKPGLLTEKFNVGQRASYVPPFRLYVFISIIFFFVLALRGGSSPEEAKGSFTPDVEIKGLEADTVAETSEAAVALSDSLIQAIDSPFLKELSVKFKTFTSDEEQSRQKLLKNTSFMMFILMPFFGFVLYLFYRRQDRNYVEHLMFSIHFHTFFFLITIVAIGIEYFIKSFEVDTWVFWIALLYLFLAMLRVYKQSFWRTFLKFLPVSFLYILSLLALFLGTLFISVMMS
ncbi:DUF3667 domain-containing protein [Pontibacter populi]|uniref:DUF3667 domain-containing protein n=1 Tax=Pontibacter populi TaxID=890055 RepID=A0ABV1RW77_9BACT